MSLEAFMYSEPYFWRADIFESATSRRNKKKKAEREAKGLMSEKPAAVIYMANFSTEENIRNGHEGMLHVIATHTDANKVMYRRNVGWISFPWGTPGTPPPTGKDELLKWWNDLGDEKAQRAAPFKGGYGVSHIIAKRDWEGKWIKPLIGQKGQDFAISLVEMIARGRVRREGSKVYIEFQPKNIRVILQRGRSEDGTLRDDLWLISGMELVKSGEYKIAID